MDVGAEVQCRVNLVGLNIRSGKSKTRAKSCYGWVLLFVVYSSSVLVVTRRGGVNGGVQADRPCT